jgi:phosphatidylethanolamine/phosphatidyl-N-methylethanolamine N-methyltransferase
LKGAPLPFNDRNRRAAPAAAPSPLEEKLADEARFIRRWLGSPIRTGAVSPSGPGLARAMAAQVDVSLPGPIVELGPGTGPVTQALIERGVPPQRLVLVEFDSGFCRLLRRRFPGVTVIQGDAFQLARTLQGTLHRPAAAVVSGLPLLNASERNRQRLLADAFRLMHPQAVFVQFTYGLGSPIPRAARNGAAVGFQASAASRIWLNLPPARVWIYRKSDAPLPHPAPLLPRALGDLKAHGGRLGSGLRQAALGLRRRLAPQRPRPAMSRASAAARAARGSNGESDLIDWSRR